MVKKAKLAKVAVLAVLVAILALTLFPGAVSAETKSSPSTDHQSIAINNGIINIYEFGETYSDGWLYRGEDQVYFERPAMSYGANQPVYLDEEGVVIHRYPEYGVPNRWYWAKSLLDLNGDGRPDVVVNRGIRVPSGAKFCYVRYEIQSLRGVLCNFRFFEGVDYDAAGSSGHDEAGYDVAGDYVWGHDTVVGTWVGFKAYTMSAHHSVASYGDMWNQVRTGVLNDSPYYAGDIGVAMEWDSLALYHYKAITLKFAFADSSDELNYLLTRTPWLP